MDNDRPTPFPDLNAVLAELAAGAQAALGANFVGAYLQGSFGVGDFDADSDVDFTIAVGQDPSAEQEAGLNAMHGRLYQLPTPWAQHLEGAYYPLELLRRQQPGSSPLLYLDNGARALARSQHDNTLVVRWVLRERGIALAGPDPRELVDPIPADALRAEIQATMREWGAEILSGGWQMESRWAQPFAALSYCRMLQSLETGTIESKLAGVRWAEARLPRRWAELAQRAWVERRDPWSKVHLRADPAEVAETEAFIAFALSRV